MATKQLRAVGIVRVSETKGRAGESFASPVEQTARIRDFCKREGLQLVATLGKGGIFEEMDVSGGTPLDRRVKGLRPAVEAVEGGGADVIVAAYFDRLVRSLRVQAELAERVETAGGKVCAVDVGEVTNGSAGQWLSSNVLGLMSEYQTRSTTERSRGAQVAAIARGVPPWPSVTAGYRRRGDGRFEPDPDTAPIVGEAFTMRANGATVREVRAFLAEHGIKLSYHGVTALLASRVVLGEIHFGPNFEPNLAAFDAIVDRETWNRVQRVKVSRGRRATSDRLLARLDVLRCATCGARMSVGSSNHGRYPLYRCPATGDCERRVTISAELVEGVVVDAVRKALAGAKGRASAEQGAREAEQALERAQSELDAAIRAFSGLEDEASARERLAELRQAREDARDRVDKLSGTTASLTVGVGDWDRLTLDERRGLIRAVVERVTVVPGRGADRVTVELVGE